MPPYTMSKNHRRLVGQQAVSLRQAQDIDSRIADRAAEIEKELMGDADRLREAMRAESSQYKLRRLEAQYLKVMADLAHVRRAHAVARKTAPKARRRMRKGLAGVFDLLKARVKGHWRQTPGGQMTWIPEYQDKRTKKQQEASQQRPAPQASLFGAGEAPTAKPQGSLFDDTPTADELYRRAENIARGNLKGAPEQVAELVRQASAQEAHGNAEAKALDEPTKPTAENSSGKTEDGRSERREGSATVREPQWDSVDAGDRRYDNGRLVYLVTRTSRGQWTLTAYNRDTDQWDRMFMGKVWKTRGGAQRHLDRYVSEYGSKYSTREFTAVDSQAGSRASNEGQSTGEASGVPHNGTVSTNADFNSTEVRFPSKPDRAVLDKLKSAGFRWSKTEKVWYSRNPGAKAIAEAALGTAQGL